MCDGTLIDHLIDTMEKVADALNVQHEEAIKLFAQIRACTAFVKKRQQLDSASD